jgi:hypothetical protein
MIRHAAKHLRIDIVFSIRLFVKTAVGMNDGSVMGI